MAQLLLPGINSFLLQAEQYKNNRFAIVTNNAAKTIDGMLRRMVLPLIILYGNPISQHKGIFKI
jgi:hypothetical protein